MVLSVVVISGSTQTELDIVARIQSLSVAHAGESIIALWDFAAAFPSVTHSWILAVLCHFGFPDGFVQFIDCLLTLNVALFTPPEAARF